MSDGTAGTPRRGGLRESNVERTQRAEGGEGAESAEGGLVRDEDWSRKRGDAGKDAQALTQVSTRNVQVLHLGSKFYDGWVGEWRWPTPLSGIAKKGMRRRGEGKEGERERGRREGVVKRGPVREGVRMCRDRSRWRSCAS